MTSYLGCGIFKVDMARKAKKQMLFKDLPRDVNGLLRVAFVLALAGGILAFALISAKNTTLLADQQAANMYKSQKALTCEESYVPVCGKDGKTYDNKCFAERQDIEVRCSGACPCK